MKRSLLLVVLVVPGWGSMLDQSFVSGGGTEIGLINECCKYVGQTYTAGLTGTLAGINIDVTGNTTTYPLDVQIQSVAGGLPTGIVLGDATVGSGTSLLPSLIMFPGTIAQVAGTQYAIVVDYPTAPSPGAGQNVGTWAGGAGSNLYPGGQDVILLGGSWVVQTNVESYFQTFVNTTPEPGTWVLMPSAAVMAFMLRRRLAARPTRQRTARNS